LVLRHAYFTDDPSKYINNNTLQTVLCTTKPPVIYGLRLLAMEAIRGAQGNTWFAPASTAVKSESGAVVSRMCLAMGATELHF